MIRRILGLGIVPGIVGVFLIAPWPLSTPPAAAAPAEDKKACGRESGDTGIAACTRAIASGRYEGADLAQIHYNRGVEYSEKGDIDRTVADYDEAIRLDPQFVEAFVNRGLSYESEGTNRNVPVNFATVAERDGVAKKVA